MLEPDNNKVWNNAIIFDILLDVMLQCDFVLVEIVSAIFQYL